MRINVYAEELTDRIECITKKAEGRNFYGLRLYLKTHEDMVPPKHQDDDQSAVTLWFLSHTDRLAFTHTIYSAAIKGVERAA